VLSRVTVSIQKNGADKARNEIKIAQAFANKAYRIVRHNMAEIEENTDDQVKELADHAFDLEKFAWDTL
jgi:hypothetical protein